MYDIEGNNMSEQVKFEVPDYVKITREAFNGAKVEVEYDSNFGGTVTVEGEAELDEGRHAREWTTLNVDGRVIRSNGHVFSGEDGRHLGTVESVTAVLSRDTAVEMVTEHVDHDIDAGEERTIIQTWDKGVIDQEGWMAGTDSITLEHC